jgi:hypothetical protein
MTQSVFRVRPEFIVAAVFALVAGAISPFGIEHLTGRHDLPFRIEVVSVCFDLFLLSLSAALVAPARVRRFFFYVLALTFPLAFISGIEAAAIAVRLADRIAPLEDTSVLANYDKWPGHLMSDARYVEKDGLLLYRPWKGDGIVINEDGLRTAPPQPKKPGEWRVALVGGSTAWGWRVLDSDTVAANLQSALRSRGQANVTVYNFGIEGSQIASDLALLKRFREKYAIDQAIFYVGLNDCVFPYLASLGPAKSVIPFGGFELVKAAIRLGNIVVSGPASPPADWTTRVLPSLRDKSELRVGIKAAVAYCQSTQLPCDFVLQPSVLDRKNPQGREASLRAGIAQATPGMDRAVAETYAGALIGGPPGHTFDLRDVFDRSARPLFVDLAHVNEAGNELIAESIATKIRIPRQ